MPTCLLRMKSFQALAASELELLETTYRELKYKAGELVLKQGGQASQVLYLKKGLVKVFVSNRGKKNILSVEPAGTILGVAGISNLNVYPYSIIAIEDSQMCVFDIKDFMKLLANNGAFASEMLVQANDYLSRCFDRMHSLIYKQINGRFANIVLCLSERIYKSTEFTLSLSRRDLAELMAMSVESLSRLIKEFSEDKIVQITGKDVKILDITKLRHIDQTG